MISRISRLVLVLLVTRFQDSRQSASSSSNSPNDWYQRYAAYPKYCSIPSEMENRSIPSLSSDSRLGETKLVHVTSIFRHGSRTPWSGNIECWKGYRENPETGVWNCNLTTVLAPPSPQTIDTEEGMPNTLNTEAMFLFEKRYDALYEPMYNLSNELWGTCQKGQLLLQGYEQEIVNGRHLRQAYVYDRTKYDHNEQMRLLDVSDIDNVWNHVYYRVDDDQRTLMSGQVVLRGLFEAEIEKYYNARHAYPKFPLHTADRDQDVLDPNENICPRLQEVRQRFYRSEAFQSYNSSKEATELRAFLLNELGVEHMDSIDCLMTTICTDRPLPDAVNDFRQERRLEDSDIEDQQEKSMFNRLYDFAVQETALLYNENDAEYAKLGISALWKEIMINIYGIIEGRDRVCCPDHATPKLALFSGHDTTLMPILASLGVWDGDWAAYASMVLIEIHDVHIDGETDRTVYQSTYAFRLIYNGQVLTHLMPGCPYDAELCDVQVLVGHVKMFEDDYKNCNRQYAVPQVHVDTVSEAIVLASTSGGVVVIILLIVISAAAGALGTYFALTGSLPRRKNSRRSPGDANEDGIALTYANDEFQRTGYRDEPNLTNDESTAINVILS